MITIEIESVKFASAQNYLNKLTNHINNSLYFLFIEVVKVFDKKISPLMLLSILD